MTAAALEYTAQDHLTWRTLYARMIPFWHRYANRHFLAGLDCLCLDPLHVPVLDEVNRFLHPRTGFAAVPVAGYVPAFEFFDHLRNRRFPTTVTVRPFAQLDYLPEPDIFHDIAGHVPMHTDAAFAEALVKFGECAQAARCEDPHVLSNRIQALARFFWFTVEFGLMRTPEGLKAYGSGLLSSHGELEQAIESAAVQRYPLQLEWVINQAFEIDHYQPLLFTIQSFDELYAQAARLAEWMRDGRLDHVAPGEPLVNERDLVSFLR